MTIDACRDFVSHHLNSDYARVIEPGQFAVEEKQASGEGKVFFSSAAPCVMLKAHNNPPLVWSLKMRSCAEAAFITHDDTGYHLHIVEMKSGLSQGDWAKVLKQFQGMFMAALAAARLLAIHEFQSVTCYIAYKIDKMGANASADLIFMKPFVGMENPIGGFDEWVSQQCTLPFNTIAAIRKAQRGADNNADFGAV